MSDDGSGAGIGIPSILIGNDNGKLLRNFYITQHPESNMTSAIIALDDKSFNDTIMTSDKVWIVEFYDPSCSHCQAFAPIYKEVGPLLQGKV